MFASGDETCRRVLLTGKAELRVFTIQYGSRVVPLSSEMRPNCGWLEMSYWWMSAMFCGTRSAKAVPHQAAANGPHGRPCGSSPHAALTLTSVIQIGIEGYVVWTAVAAATMSSIPPFTPEDPSPTNIVLSETLLSQ